MPSLQTVDLNPIPRTTQTPLEKTLSAFSNRARENQKDQYETDALREIYDQHKRDGGILEDAIMSVQTRPGLSPTTRVNSINQLLKLQKTNAQLQTEAEKKQKITQKQELEEAKKKKEEADEIEKKKLNQDKLEYIEKQRGLESGSLAPFANDPAMAERITKPRAGPSKTQASQPIDDDQLKRIQHVRSKEEFEKASNPKKYQMLTDAGVSKENAKAEVDVWQKESEIDRDRESIINKKQAEADFSFVDEQSAKVPELFARQQVLEQANALNEEGVTGQAWDLAMQKVGLLQYTDEGYRVFASLAKDAVKNQNIRSVIGSQISQMEFGFFRDATINPSFSKEANRQIMRKENLALRYEKLYADITKKLVEQNEGQIPPRIQNLVNEEFAKQSGKISKELKEAALDFDAIQNVPKGKVLMYDKKRRPLHVPANQVEKYSKLGATSS